MLLLSGCKVKDTQDDGSFENTPSEEQTTDNANENSEPMPDPTDENEIFLKKELVEVKYVGDGFVVFNAFNSFDPNINTINFKCNTDFKYAKEQDTALFTGGITPLEEGEYSHVAKQNAAIKFGFDPDNLDIHGEVSLVGDGYVIVSVRDRNIKLYAEDPTVYDVGDDIYLTGKAEAVQSYTEGEYEISFELKTTDLTVE